MIITLSLIIGTSIGLLSGLITGGLSGYLIGNRTRTDREMEENYNNLLNYYANIGEENI